MDLSQYQFPKVTNLDMVFPTFNAPAELVAEANSRKLTKGRKAFSDLFYNGGSVTFQPDFKGTWKEDAFRFARALMRSFAPKHEDKEAVCAMIFEECLVL